MHLTTSEEKIIRHFIKLDKAEILWDADKYYLDNAEPGIRYFPSSLQISLEA